MLRAARYAVVGLWVALLLALARSHLPSTAVVTTQAPGEIVASAGEDWMGLYMRGEKIGYTHSRTRPVDGGFHFEETSHMRLSVLDQVQTVHAVIDATTAPDYSLRQFQVSLDSGVGAFAVRGTVEGAGLKLRTSAGGQDSEQALALSGPLFLPSSARAHLHAVGLAPGAAVTLQVFDPAGMEYQPLQARVVGREAITVGGEKRDAWKVVESFRGIDSTVWLDDEGHALREEGPMGLTAVRETAQQAVGEGWSATAFDLMSAVAVRVDPPLDAPRERQHLKLRLAGLGDLPVPSDRRQVYRDGVLDITREPVGRAAYTLPYQGEDWRGELQSTPFLQADHPRVQALATEIAGGATDPVRVAQRLRDWVYEEIEKRPAATIPNALQVLDMRAGDCNEHAVLFAALARAVGLPARVVAGVVYADGAFLYHAWDEVWIGSGWLSVDAALDQIPVDATHVKLIEGGPEKHAALIPVIGRLTIDVLPDAVVQSR